MEFLVAAKVSDISPGSMKAVDVGGHALLLAHVDGQWHAVSRKCTHFGANLCNGVLVKGVVTCPKHGAQFNVTNGQAVGKAKILIFTKQPKNLATFPVKVEGEKILVGV